MALVYRPTAEEMEEIESRAMVILLPGDGNSNPVAEHKQNIDGSWTARVYAAEVSGTAAETWAWLLAHYDPRAGEPAPLRS